MNKIVVSLGMAALGASGIQIASAQESAPPAKPWNLTASLRGFYDDNINTLPQKQDAFGFEVSPGGGLNWVTDTTTLRAGYTYSFKYYDVRQNDNSDKYDQVHTFMAALDHAFNERFNIHVADSFVVGQEPDVLAGDRPLSTSQYISGDNIRNYGTITLNGQLTPLFGFLAAYDNEYFNYDDDGPFSNSAMLDRIQNGVTLEGNFLVQPETKALIGAKFQDVDYTADEIISLAPATMSDEKNSRAYIAYLGAEHSFNPDLSGSIRAGIQYNDYYNTSIDGECNPYIQATGKYLYAPESYADIGFTQTRSATDVGTATEVVRDADISLLYGSIHHRITPRVFGTLSGTFQNFIYNGGGSNIDGKSQQYYSAGANLQYRFNPFLSTEIGYNFDATDSDVTAKYTRNRVYIGLTASY